MINADASTVNKVLIELGQPFEHSENPLELKRGDFAVNSGFNWVYFLRPDDPDKKPGLDNVTIICTRRADEITSSGKGNFDDGIAVMGKMSSKLGMKVVEGEYTFYVFY